MLKRPRSGHEKNVRVVHRITIPSLPDRSPRLGNPPNHADLPKLSAPVFGGFPRLSNMCNKTNPLPQSTRHQMVIVRVTILFSSSCEHSTSSNSRPGRWADDSVHLISLLDPNTCKAYQHQQAIEHASLEGIIVYLCCAWAAVCP